MGNNLLDQDLLTHGLKELGIPFSYKQLELCQKFFLEYEHYRKKINISNITDPKEFVIKHIFDSVSSFSFLSSAKTIADLGSGGGFPGLILGIFLPKTSISLIDVVQKKVDYLHYMIETLSLPNINVFNASKQKIEGPFDFIVSRAVGNIQKILLFSKSYRTDKTKFLLYKGRLDTIEKEIESLPKDYKVEIIPISVPFLDAERHILLLSKIKNY